MLTFALRRLGRFLFVLLVVTAASHLMLELLPGDPVVTILGVGATEEGIAELRARLNLDEPWPVRYLSWLWGLLQGDFGFSYLTQQPVGEALAERLSVTLELVVLSQVVALAIAIPLGIASAYRPGGRFDRFVTSSTFLLLAVPPFVLAVLLSLVFAVQLGWLPATGYVPFTRDPWGNLRSLTLPVVTLAVGALAPYARILRAEMIGTLQEDYISVARAKGMPPWYVLTRHALRPSMFTLITVAGLSVGGLIGGTVIIEQLFGLPGLGNYLLAGIQQRDYIAAQGALVVIVVGYVVVNFLVDVLYSVIDPRVRSRRAAG
ncbi:ABC transporter permease [Pseudonocardia nigra]|uniref:ABC transporter permease n=1 Tax=Pseudonocardia nigra TaxID=1921578 RepID=UPI001C603B5C|nr:ABC transporter permease [Pseudonocardia nigra]